MLTLGPRPRLRAIPRLDVDVVFTLLQAPEQPSQIGDVTRGCGKLWVHRPLSVRESDYSPDWRWLDAAQCLRTLLVKKQRVYLHCAAGIHRTGSLAYMVARLGGLEHDTAVEFVFALRPVIRDEVGDKIDLARAVFERVSVA